MGYTHYWDQYRDFTPDEWARIKERFNHLMNNLPPHSHSAGGQFSDQPLIIKDGLGEGDGPIVTDEEIIFNGDSKTITYIDYLKRYDDMAFETFELFRIASKGNFCKTGRRPYDLVVCVTLLIAALTAPGAIKIKTDGGEDDWQSAHELYLSLFVLNNS